MSSAKANISVYVCIYILLFLQLKILPVRALDLQCLAGPVNFFFHCSLYLLNVSMPRDTDKYMIRPLDLSSKSYLLPKTLDSTSKKKQNWIDDV